MNDCIFCKIVAGSSPAYIIKENEGAIAFLDLSQASVGHTLVIPKSHCKNMLDCRQDELISVNLLAQEVALLLKDKLGTDAFNIVSNIEYLAGQRVFHYHLHIIPRYPDDDSYQIIMKSHQVDLKALWQKIVN